ncbi:hypothetical protein CPB84DRAFT_1782349 [Gymnopilus junonius]|uniref:Vacuolar sorting protein Vps3844 C-terminal domain-containing protein n=1 Tax=Gymnopilus junonius TaxID=109634 RepID=A0A9P5TLW1_GYMJU|nr:hypothetical protein CPB84DRAFT_1782349 [Gymnopilus junonius]
MLSSTLLALSAALQLVQAIDVYLSPPSSLLRSRLSPEQASAALSRHLGLEAFEPFQEWTHYEESFVGQGLKNALILAIDQNDAPAILPYSLPHAFSLEQPPSTQISSPSSVLYTYLHHASQTYDSIYSSFDFGEPSDVASLVSFLESADQPSLVAIELTKLHEIRETYGRFSGAYTQVTEELHSLLERLCGDDRFSVAVLEFVPTSFRLEKRQDPKQTQIPLPPNIPAPQLPIGAISTCFTTLDACNNGTSTCSGRGQCVEASKAGRTCFVCSCGATKTGEGNQVKTIHWAGESCERKDISGPFVLISGTVLAIILTIIGSVYLLHSVGNQPLPSTLLATAVNARKE